MLLRPTVQVEGLAQLSRVRHDDSVGRETRQDRQAGVEWREMNSGWFSGGLKC